MPRLTSLWSPCPVTPALADLQLTTVGSDSVQVDWKADESSLRGYWLTWEGQESSNSGHRSSFYLPPDSQSTHLTNLPPSARVCVSPIYRTARGEGLCCTAQFDSGKFSDGTANFVWTIYSYYYTQASPSACLFHFHIYFLLEEWLKSTKVYVWLQFSLKVFCNSSEQSC